MATPTIPALLDPTQYTLVLTPGTYTDLVAQTLGNVADPSDGFDAALSISAARHQAMLASLPGFDADLLSLGQVTPYFDAHPAADLATQLQPVSDAVDLGLASYLGIVTPAPVAVGGAVPVSAGAVLGQPTIRQANDFPGWTLDFVIQANVMRVGDPVQSLTFTPGAYDPPHTGWDELEFPAGDARVFKVYFPNLVPIGIANPPQPIAYVDVAAAIAGHWWAVITLHAQFDPAPAKAIGIVVDILS